MSIHRQTADSWHNLLERALDLCAKLQDNPKLGSRERRDILSLERVLGELDSEISSNIENGLTLDFKSLVTHMISLRKFFTAGDGVA